MSTSPAAGTPLTQHRLAVLGSPIAHSQSPAIHSAAYAVLDLDWTYRAEDVTGETLAAFVNSRDASWRGLSLTMPLKRDVLPLLDSRDAVVDLAGGANTLLFDDRGPRRILRGFNTDVVGIRRAFESAGVARLGSVQVLGGGATAASAIVAAHELGAERALISVRSPLKALSLAQLGEQLGMVVTVRDLGDASPQAEDTMDAGASLPDAVISTLPGGVDTGALFAEKLRAHSVLFDVAYDPWPSALALQWAEAGGVVVPGIDMLLFQALTQIRIFLTGDPEVPLPRESTVLEAMRAAVGR